MPDADLETSAVYMRQGCFGMTGQRCLGSDNVVVIGDIYEELKQRLVDQAKGMKLGYGLDESVGMGPYASPEGRDKVAGWIERAIEEGADMVYDGRRSNPRNTPADIISAPPSWKT